MHELRGTISKAILLIIGESKVDENSNSTFLFVGAVHMKFEDFGTGIAGKKFLNLPNGTLGFINCDS